MSYVSTTLSQGEAVTHSTNIHWASCAMPFILLLISLSIAPLLSLLFFCIIVVRIIDILTTEIAITNRKLVVKQGLIMRNTIEQQLNKIDSVQVAQGLIGRILGYGTLTIHGSGLSTSALKRIAHPIIFRKNLQTSIDTYINRVDSRSQRARYEENDDLEETRSPRYLPRRQGFGVRSSDD